MIEKIKEIANHYGFKNQSMQTIEELSELIKSICKYDRYEDSADHLQLEILKKNIIDELADTEIMTSQLKYILGCEDEVEKVKEYKLERQLNRIRKEK